MEDRKDPCETFLQVKVVFNWDLRPLKVCRKAKMFMESISIEPIIDAKNLTKEMFKFSPGTEKCKREKSH